jgi:MFS family permease
MTENICAANVWSKNLLSKQNVLAACVFIDMFAVSLVVPLLPIRYKELGITPVLIGTMGSIYRFTQIFGGIAYGVVSDRLEDRRTVLLVSFAGAAISYALVSP